MYVQIVLKSMKNKAVFFNIYLIFNVLILNSVAQVNRFKKGFVSNENVLYGLNSRTDLNDPVSVFGQVFLCLSQEVTVFPSENYYYFNLNINGMVLWGSMSLSADKRDKGIISFGYIEKSNDFMGEDNNAAGGSKELSAADGLKLEKVNPFRYKAVFNGKTVFFNLNKLNLSKPVKAKLMQDEVLVGPNYDESGLQFFLVFNATEKKMYWILNEETYVPEGFDKATDFLFFGRRTGFAFFNDSINNRKILVGVDANNVLKNNWYDGPFDQMPDNHVYTGELEVKKYIEATYPADSGRIDKYGNYLEEEGVRIAIAPYYAYYSKEDLIAMLEDCLKNETVPSSLYSCLTKQIFYLKD